MDFEIIIRFECPECGKDALIPLQFEPVWTGENPATPEVQDVMIECPHCGKKLKGHAWATPSASSVEFIDYPDTLVEAMTPTLRGVEDDWDDYDVPADPYSIFNASMAESRFLLDQHGGDGASLLNRMVFAHYISAIEAFLADTIINAVQEDGEALRQLIQQDSNLRARKFSLAQISASPSLIKDTVRTRLREELWHRLRIANSLYKASFDIDILALLGKNTAIVEQAIHLRHDCVHRNGRDKDGNALAAFTKDYVIGIGEILSRLAHDIVMALNDRKAHKFFGPPEPF